MNNLFYRMVCISASDLEDMFEDKYGHSIDVRDLIWDRYMCSNDSYKILDTYGVITDAEWELKIELGLMSVDDEGEDIIIDLNSIPNCPNKDRILLCQMILDEGDFTKEDQGYLLVDISW